VSRACCLECRRHFVDIGLERTAFLHVADIANVPNDDTIVLPSVDDIRRLVSPGDDILVQVIKDPLGTKGARLTTFIALPFPLSRLHASR